MTLHSEINEKLNEGDVIIRSTEVHSYHLAALKENAEITESTYVIVEISCL